MMIARWSFDARFSHKDEAIDLVKKWISDVASQIGLSADTARVLSGSASAPESTIQVEFEVSDLAELNEAWDRLADADGHRQWGRAMEEHIVSGSPRWEVFRVAA